MKQKFIIKMTIEGLILYFTNKNDCYFSESIKDAYGFGTQAEVSTFINENSQYEKPLYGAPLIEVITIYA